MANDYDYPAYSGPHGPFVFSDGSISEFTCKCGKLLGNCHDAVIDSAYNETDCIRVWASIADSRPRLLAVFSPEEWADASISVQKRPFTEWGEPFGPPIETGAQEYALGLEMGREEGRGKVRRAFGG